MIQAVIFDMDGVLIDSEPFWRESETWILQNLGLPVTYKMVKKNTGIRIDKAVENWFSLYPWEGPGVAQVTEMIIEETLRRIRTQGSLKEGVLKILDLLSRTQIPNAIASSAPYRVIMTTVKKLRIDNFFQLIYSGEFEKYPKPFPDIFLMVAGKMNVKPEECLVIEDSPVGIEAAKRAGMKCLAVPDKNNFHHPSVKKADFLINSLNEFDENLLTLISDR